MDELQLTTPYHRGVKGDISVTYLTRKKSPPKESPFQVFSAERRQELQGYAGPSHTYTDSTKVIAEEWNAMSESRKAQYVSPRWNNHVSVVKEEIGDILCLRNCCLYLHITFSDRDFTRAEVERCFSIFVLLTQKATHTECMDDKGRCDVCFEDYYVEAGFFTDKRRNVVKFMLQAETLMIACYNINEQGHDDWKCSSKWSIERKKTDPVAIKYPTFTLMELLENDWAYDVFVRFWTSVRDHESCRRAFPPYIPKDIVNYIYEKLTPDTNF